MEKWWTKFWHLRVPPKVKLFCWRVCLGQIPARVVLAKKRITSDDSCPVCQEARETVFHTFWGCRWSRRVWKEVGFGHILPPFRDSDIFDAILRATETLEVGFHELFITIIWELWNHRNNVLAGRSAWSQPQLVQWTVSFLEEYRAATVGDTPTSMRVTTTPR